MAIMDTMDTTKKRNRNVGILIIIVLSLALAGCLYSVLGTRLKDSDDDESDYHNIVYKDKNYKYNTSIVSFLILGIDKTDDEERINEQGQSDAMELLLFNRNTKTIEFVSLQRDSITEIEYTPDDVDENIGWNEDHLSLAYAYGHGEKSGCMHAMRAVSRMLFDVPIRYYASMDLRKLADLQNIVGTLEVKVPNNTLKSYNRSWTKGSIAKIDSSNVEKFLRYRDINEDFSNETRMERQKMYFQAYYKKIRTMLKNDFDNTVSKVYSLLKDLCTNVSYEDLITFGNMALEYSFDLDKSYYTLPGQNVRGVEYDEYHLDQDALKALVVQLFYVPKEGKEK